jgi:hypothetical protein
MDREQLNEELRYLRDCLERGQITDAYYQQAVARLRAAAGSAWPGDPFFNAKGDSYTPRRATRLLDLLPDQEMGPVDNRFRLVREIGGGAMGRVWLAHDLEEEKLEGGERYKALKVVNPQLLDSPRALELLKREAVRASQLTHPNIINTDFHSDK